uniref:Uncharacterized protein n=1 Tax=Palpitomonas bilix TaxID=652834 RepID=A0A7S3GEP6_9EUKA|mmetsp:Transcript_46387/g.119715  ORF Transcript_46387/g.119715 Transcript_46387/m.119715 type:complete len:253 (+) Transcript_46387:252-1010(+)
MASDGSDGDTGHGRHLEDEEEPKFELPSPLNWWTTDDGPPSTRSHWGFSSSFFEDVHSPEREPAPPFLDESHSGGATQDERPFEKRWVSPTRDYDVGVFFSERTLHTLEEGKSNDRVADFRDDTRTDLVSIVPSDERRSASAPSSARGYAPTPVRKGLLVGEMMDRVKNIESIASVGQDDTAAKNVLSRTTIAQACKLVGVSYKTYNRYTNTIRRARRVAPELLEAGDCSYKDLCDKIAEIESAQLLAKESE